MLDFGREVCGNPTLATDREWLITNGIGGYASGTVAGMLTRRYHGLLIAALQPPLGRTLLVTKVDEQVTYDGQAYALGANQWAGGVIEPEGFRYLERFHLAGTSPVWTYACADALLEKRLWMQFGANTTYLQYRLRRGTAPLRMVAKILVNYRDHHGRTLGGNWQMQLVPLENGLQVTAYEGATPFYLLSDPAGISATHIWYRDFFLRLENKRGLDDQEDHLYAADLEVTLYPGQTATLVFSTNVDPNLDGNAAYAERQAYEQGLLAQAAGPLQPEHASQTEAEVSRRLVLAADQFIVRRPLPDDGEGFSVIAGYPWFGDWGRDTMIALAGLTLVTGRPEVAAGILRTYARFVDQGMLPNRLPEAGQTPEYNTVDAALWLFEALRAYQVASGDDELLRELFPVLEEIVAWHRRGTRYGIGLDPADGLLYAGEEGWQLTWMDAKVGDWVVTPRIGKPVEVNALWYNALRLMAGMAESLGQPAADYTTLAEQAQAGFARFWNAASGYCFDVLDGPGGDDAALRPNQLLAVSLAHSPLPQARQRAVVDVCARQLLTSPGLRSLAPGHPDYRGRYGGDRRQRDGAYHQGTVWSWLIGSFVAAHLRVYGDPALARSYLDPLIRHLSDHGLGSVSEIFDGEPPFTPRGCIAQAWGVAEVLRAWQATAAGPTPPSRS